MLSMRESERILLILNEQLTFFNLGPIKISKIN